jgi:putative membrane protein
MRVEDCSERAARPRNKFGAGRRGIAHRTTDSARFRCYGFVKPSITMMTHTRKTQRNALLRTRLAAVVIAASSVVIGTAVSAQQTAPQTTQPSSSAPTTTQTQTNPNTARPDASANGGAQPKVTDPDFIVMAGIANNEEIAESRYALVHSTNPLVKQFAQRMIGDHSAAKVSLQGAARTVGVTVPANISSNDAMMNRRLMTVSGAAFDTAYMTGQVADHTKMVALLRAEAAQTKDATLQAFATAQLPVVLAHLHAAQAYQVSNGQTLGLTPQVGNGVGGGDPTTGSLNNGIPLSNGSSQEGGTSATTGSGLSGSNTGQQPLTLPTPVPVRTAPSR